MARPPSDADRILLAAFPHAICKDVRPAASMPPILISPSRTEVIFYRAIHHRPEQAAGGEEPGLCGVSPSFMTRTIDQPSCPQMVDPNNRRRAEQKTNSVSAGNSLYYIYIQLPSAHLSIVALEPSQRLPPF